MSLLEVKVPGPLASLLLQGKHGIACVGVGMGVGMMIVLVRVPPTDL